MDQYLKDYREKMEKSISIYTEDLKNVRVGRANPSLLDKISVEYYGAMTPLNQIAGISAPEARLITIQPWDEKLIPEIEKAILASDLGLNPSNDGKIIRLAIPALTTERREELTKVVSGYGEDAKVHIRNIRRDAIDEIKKDEKAGDISEDDKKRLEDEAQKLTDEFIKKIDELTSKKQDDIMEI